MAVPSQHLWGVPVLPEARCAGSTPEVQTMLLVDPDAGEEEVADPCNGAMLEHTAGNSS